MVHQAHTTGQAVERADGFTPLPPAVARREGFRAELKDLRERMRGLGLGFDEIAGEIARQYRLRPRESYRLAWGWSLVDAAARFNALAAQEGTDPQGRAPMTGAHFSEYEHWPSSGRKPSVYLLIMLARLYETDVLSLLDLADHENLAPQDRLTLIRRPVPRADTMFGRKLVALAGERGLSLREVARRVPCSPAHLSNIAHGRKGASGQLAGLLDRVLDAGGELEALAGPAAREDQEREPRSSSGPARRADLPAGSRCGGLVVVAAICSRPPGDRDSRTGGQFRAGGPGGFSGPGERAACPDPGSGQ